MSTSSNIRLLKKINHKLKKNKFNKSTKYQLKKIEDEIKKLEDEIYEENNNFSKLDENVKIPIGHTNFSWNKKNGKVPCGHTTFSW